MINISFDDHITARLAKFGQNIDTAQITTAMAASVENNFAVEGPNWAPLADKTIEERLAQGYDAGPILTRSGALRRGFIKSNDQTSATLSDPSIYGVDHHTGTGKMPARPFFVWKNDLIRKIKEIILKTI